MKEDLSCDLNGKPPQVFITPIMPSIFVDNNWYMNTSATHHLTSKKAHLQQVANYIGVASIILGNGISIYITHFGNTSLSCGSHTFHLNQLLCASHLKKT